MHIVTIAVQGQCPQNPIEITLSVLLKRAFLYLWGFKIASIKRTATQNCKITNSSYRQFE
jgi:hypothetical protein